jgi:hypothetical protein
MTCRPFEYRDKAGVLHRGIACSRGRTDPPPCPFPVDLSPSGGDLPSLPAGDPFASGAPFLSPRHGAGVVVGRVLGDATRIAVRFAGGRVVSYDLATLRARQAGDRPFG